MRPRDFLDVLENAELPACDVPGEAPDLLRAMLVHLLFADLELDRCELAMLQRVLPGSGARETVKSLAARRLDLDRLAALFPDPEDRRDIVRLAEHAAWGNAKLERREASLIERIAEKLGVARG